MNKKPKIYKPDMSFIDNNKKTYCSYLEDRSSIKDENYNKPNSKEDIINFINKLSSSESYVFNKNIKIKTKNDEFETRIAGKIGNRLITLDNKSINIDDIIDIYEK